MGGMPAPCAGWLPTDARTARVAAWRRSVMELTPDCGAQDRPEQRAFLEKCIVAVEGIDLVQRARAPVARRELAHLLEWDELVLPHGDEVCGDTDALRL